MGAASAQGCKEHQQRREKAPWSFKL